VKYNIDPELEVLLEFLPELQFDDTVAARAGMDEMISAMLQEVDSSDIDIADRSIAAPDQDHQIPIRIYLPARTQSVTAGLLYIHGGGFAVGNLDSEHAGVVSLCRDLGIVIVSVGYRLAPEHPYPAALEDCFSAVNWLHHNAEDLGIDTARIAIMGGSAGGGLAAALALLAKERGGPSICFQYLGIPELDDRLLTPSMTAFTDTPMWNRPNAELSWRYYLGEQFAAGGDDVPITAAPARASTEQLAGLPPACVTTMEFDPLRDEGINYAVALMHAGVSVELHSYPGTFHGSSLVATAAVSMREARDTRAVLRRGLKMQ
jgi:acetyl esterase